MKTAKTPKTARPDQPKQPYSKPKLVSYGDICEVTRMVGNSGMDDGGGGKAGKTAL